MKKLFVLLILCGVAYSCSTKYILSKKIENVNPQIVYTDTISANRTDRAIAEIIEEKFIEFKDYEPLWGIVAIMDTESGYTRTISCDATDQKIGGFYIDYTKKNVSPGRVVLPLYYMELLNKGGASPSDPVNIDTVQDTIEGVVIKDVDKIEAKTLREAFIKGSSIAIARECHEKLNFNNLDLEDIATKSNRVHLDELLMMCNSIASGGCLIKCKYDINEPTRKTKYFSEEVTEECKNCMIQHAQDNDLGNMAIYSSTAEQLYAEKPNSLTTQIGFVLSDNPKCSVLVSLNTRKPLPSKGVQILPAIINELNEE